MIAGGHYMDLICEHNENLQRSYKKLASQKILAEREGFEPSIRLTVYTLSRRAP